MESTALATPIVTLSTFAKAMGAQTPASLARLLRGHKYRASGPRRAYQNARRQAIDLLVDGAPLDERVALRRHEREAVAALKRCPLKLPAWTRAIRSTDKHRYWDIHGVRISMQPDVELSGRLQSGAVKFAFDKQRLAPNVGSMMAALLWRWYAMERGEKTTTREHCIVYEPRLPWLHRPGRDPVRQLASAEMTCRLIAALWPAL